MKRFIIAAALAATVTAPAFAASDTFSMEINYSRAALETKAAAEAEYDAIRKQVAERCTAENAAFGIAPAFIERRCTVRVMDKAVRRINHPLLDEVHAERR